MHNEHERSRLDGVIDAVVHDMMQSDARAGFTARVLRALDEPAPRPWFVRAPALAAASFAVLVVVAAVMLLGRQPAAPDVPSIQVASGVPAALPVAIPAPQAPAIPAAGGARTADVPRSTPPAAPTSESIFGPRSAAVAAASVPATNVIWVELTLIESSPSGEQRRQPVTIVLRRDARPGTPISRAEGAFQLTVVPEFVPDGVNLAVELQSPVSRKFTAALRPGEVERSQVFETVDSSSGRRTVIEARARFLGPDAQR